MRQISNNWIRLISTAITGVGLYHLGLVVSFFLIMMLRSSLVQVPIYYVFFLIPLQVLGLRRGRKEFLYGALLSLLIFLIFRWYLADRMIRNLAESAGSQSFGTVIWALMTIELVTLIALVGGLAALNYYQREGWGVLRKCLTATLLSGILGLILVYLVLRSGTVETAFASLFADGAKYLEDLGVEEGSLPSATRDPALLLRSVWQYVQNGTIFGYFINLALAWYAGRLWVERGKFRGRIERFSLSEGYIWPLIGFWALVLAGRFVDLHGFEGLAWNGGLVFLSLYALQGTAIIRHLMKRFRSLRSPFSFFILGILALILFPPFAVILMTLVAALGVSEIWIKYRTHKKETEEE